MLRKRRNTPPSEPQIEKLLRAASTIGHLEILAGIDRSPDGRSAFWDAYKRITPPGASLDTGCAEVRRLAREKAGLNR